VRHWGSKQRNVIAPQNLWNKAEQLLNHADGHPQCPMQD
jgi:hypothetical protein